jgi:hypothetical protein
MLANGVRSYTRLTKIYLDLYISLIFKILFCCIGPAALGLCTKKSQKLSLYSCEFAVSF